MCLIDLKECKGKEFYKVVFKYKGMYYGIYTGVRFCKSRVNVAINSNGYKRDKAERLMKRSPSEWDSPKITGFLSRIQALNYQFEISHWIAPTVPVRIIKCKTKGKMWEGKLPWGCTGSGMSAVCTDRASFVKEVN